MHATTVASGAPLPGSSDILLMVPNDGDINDREIEGVTCIDLLEIYK